MPQSSPVADPLADSDLGCLTPPSSWGSPASIARALVESLPPVMASCTGLTPDLAPTVQDTFTELCKASGKVASITAALCAPQLLQRLLNPYRPDEGQLYCAHEVISLANTGGGALGPHFIPRLPYNQGLVTRDGQIDVDAVMRQVAHFQLGHSRAYNSYEIRPAGPVKVKSRDHVSLETVVSRNRATGDEMVAKNPFIASNMFTIASLKFAQVLADLGSIPIVRYLKDPTERVEAIKALKGRDYFLTVRSSELKVAQDLCKAGARGICLEMGTVDDERAFEFVRRIKEDFPTVHIMVGNVSTPEAYLRMVNAGADVVKTGRGSGSICLTPYTTHTGVRMFTALYNIDLVRQELSANGLPEAKVIADGGISNSGHIVCASALGADAVMCGMLSATMAESAGALVLYDGKPCKVYAGEASDFAQTAHGEVRAHVAAQGILGIVPVKGPAADILARLMHGVQAGIADNGAASLIEFRDRPLSFLPIDLVAHTERGTRVSDVGVKELSLPDGRTNLEPAELHRMCL